MVQGDKIARDDQAEAETAELRAGGGGRVIALHEAFEYAGNFRRRHAVAVVRDLNDDPLGARITLEGPTARLAPNVALALSMALHELATNAVKYGALSAPEGRVSVAWSMIPGGKALALEWAETGGPPVEAPRASGFGTRLLAGLAGEFGAAADLAYAPGGVTCRLTVPVA